MNEVRQRIGDRVERLIAERGDPEAEIQRGEEEAQRAAPSLRRTVFWLAVTGGSLYLVAPGLIDVLGSWRDLRDIEPIWFAAMAVLQGLAIACLWVVQRIALHDAPWAPVINSQLAGNAMARIAPAGGAVGAALQYRMLVEAGIDRARAVAGITAVNLLTFAVVLVLPVLALPALLGGPVDPGLVEAVIIGLVVFVLLLAAGIAALAFDEPLRWVGGRVQRLRNRLRRGAPPLTGFPDRLQRERDRLLETLGPRWREAVAVSLARWAFDYATLLAALAAVGTQPRPFLVLLAFCAAQLLAQVPLTPGGLGFVEAGLTATLVLAGVGAGAAVLATLAYRLFSYWLLLPVGLGAYAAHRRWLARR